jgi:hypothetical protein
MRGEEFKEGENESMVRYSGACKLRLVEDVGRREALMKPGAGTGFGEYA